MRRVLLLFLPFIMIFSCRFDLFADSLLEYSLRPGYSFYSDTIGLNLSGGISFYPGSVAAGFPREWYFGIAANYQKARAMTNGITLMQGMFETGWRTGFQRDILHAGGFLQAGAGWSGIDTPGLSTNAVFFAFTPGVRIGLTVARGLTVGIEGAYAIQFLPMEIHFLPSASVYVAFSPEQAVDAKNPSGLAGDIRNTIGGDTNLVSVSDTSDEIVIQFSDILFATGKTDVTGESLEVVERLGKLLGNYAGVRIVVEGHTDDRGDAELNQKLSEERAKSVSELLVKNGVKPAAVSFKGFGKTRPMLPNSSDENRRRNRRVEIHLIREAAR